MYHMGKYIKRYPQKSKVGTRIYNMVLIRSTRESIKQ